MQIKIKTHHINLAESQDEMIRSKVKHLATLAERIKDESSEIKVDLSHDHTRAKEDAYSCTITMFIPNDTLRAEAYNSTLENSVDDVISKIKPQIKHYKSKFNRS